LAKFGISNNAIRAGGTAAIAGALKGNTILTELDLSSNQMEWNDAGSKRDISGVAALADAIPDMGALTKLIFGGDGYHIGNEWVTPEPAALEVGMTKADLSNKHLGVGGAIIISAWISHKDYGALTSLNISDNYLTNNGRDTSGKPREHVCVWPPHLFGNHFCAFFPFLQVLPPSLMPSAAMGR
jgi:hypothetical protein